MWPATRAIRAARKHTESSHGHGTGLALLLMLLVGTPAPAVAKDTIADFISRKLQDLDLLPGGDDVAPKRLPGTPGTTTASPATTGKQAPRAPAAGRATATLDNRPGSGKVSNGNVATPATPLPRPRPAALAGHRQTPPSAAPRRTAVLADAAGRVLVDPKQLLQERDHTRAVYLKPREIGRWDAATVQRVRRNCNIVLAALNVDAEPLPSIGGPEGCGIAAPLLVRALGVARMQPAAKLNCRMAAALHEWMRKHVQPAARKHFGQPVVKIRQLSHYACRRRGGITRGPVRISEHSFGNAIDIGHFELADGRRISLLKDWGEFSALFNRKSAFLADVRKGACAIFSTVLSPKYNKAHANHFHLDLGRGGRYKICK